MPAGELAERYAHALFELAGEGGVQAQVTEELGAVNRTIRVNPPLERCLADPLLPAAAKQAVFGELFGKLVRPLTLDFLGLLMARRRGSLLPGVVQEMDRRLREALGIASVQVALARPMPVAAGERLRSRLARLLGKQVELESTVDPSLLGGIIIRVGDHLIDGSCRGQLEALRYQLRIS